MGTFSLSRRLISSDPKPFGEELDGGDVAGLLELAKESLDQVA